MKRFEIGEVVIALTNPRSERCQPRTKGSTYVVCAIQYCSKCGTQLINIGPKARINISGIGVCSCGSYMQHEGLCWTKSDLFARPQELQAEIQEAVAVENYEKAHELQQLLTP